MDLEVATALRRAQETGERLTVFLPNRRQDGHAFVNLLDLRGFRVAQDMDSGDYLWYLVGVQADVTNLTEAEKPTNHVNELQEVANAVRDALAKELLQMVIDQAEFGASAGTATAPWARYRVLPQPEWLADGGWESSTEDFCSVSDRTMKTASSQVPAEPHALRGIADTDSDKASTATQATSKFQQDLWHPMFLVAGAASAVTLAAGLRQRFK